MLKTGSMTSTTQVVVKFDPADDVRWCWWQVGQKIVKKSKKPQRSEKFLKAISSEECLPNVGKISARVPNSPSCPGRPGRPEPEY